MHLDLYRRLSTEHTTLGDLFVDEAFECHTLEDVVRENNIKVWGATAIPAGTYRIVVNISPRFGKRMPRLCAVPGFDGILIHKGNKNEDTHGCILVGNTIANEDLITHSTAAYDALFPRLQAAYDAGEELTITIHSAKADS